MYECPLRGCHLPAGPNGECPPIHHYGGPYGGVPQAIAWRYYVGPCGVRARWSVTDARGEEHLVCGAHRDTVQGAVHAVKIQMPGEELARKGLNSALWGLAMPLLGGVGFLLKVSAVAIALAGVAAPTFLLVGLIMGLIALSRLRPGEVGRGRAAAAVALPLGFVVAWIVLAQFY